MQFSAMPVVRPRAMRFFLALAVLMLAVVAVGFGPSLYLRRVLGTVDRFGPSLPPHLLAHGAALTVWYVLFVVQAFLVRTGRRDVHRRLGVHWGVVVSVTVVASSLITMRLLVARLGAGGGSCLRGSYLSSSATSGHWLPSRFSSPRPFISGDNPRLTSDSCCSRRCSSLAPRSPSDVR